MGFGLHGQGLLHPCPPSYRYQWLLRRPPSLPAISLLLPTSKPMVPISRLRISSGHGKSRITVCLSASNSEENQTAKEAIFDIGLPRRSLMVQFTCNACGERSQRTINRNAFERGTVFVQCAGCLVHHELVDNLGLVVEYDLREDMSSDANKSE